MSTTRLRAICDLLASPLASSILQTHPNDLCGNYYPPDEWRAWWDWAGRDEGGGLEAKWIKLVRYYNRSVGSDPQTHLPTSVASSVDKKIDIPDNLVSLIDEIRALQLDRSPFVHKCTTNDVPGMAFIPCKEPQRPRPGFGMSPKKDHEVARMSAFVADLLKNWAGSGRMKHVVDIGAGQGYLTRALASLPAPLAWADCLPSSDSLNSTDNQAASQPQRASLDRTEHVHSQTNEYCDGNVESRYVTLLALDSDNAQTSGAERWVQKVRNFERKKNKKSEPRQLSEPFWSNVKRNREKNAAGALCGDLGEGGGITHKTIHITPTTLLSSIDEWISSETELFGFREPAAEQASNPVPVLFVALHACGSLTPDIIRAFLLSREASNDGTGRRDGWIAAGVLVVGCCYNLLSPSDFPLSHALSQLPRKPPIPLPLSYLHLAAQIPSTWLLTEKSTRDAKLAIRKVVWRALVGGLINSPSGCLSQMNHDVSATAASQSTSLHVSAKTISDMSTLDSQKNQAQREDYRRMHDLQTLGTGNTLTHRRLGKINNKAYENWEDFLKVAGEKMGVHLSTTSHSILLPVNESANLSPLEESQYQETEKARWKNMESRLEVLHVLRCLLGPLVESMILLDRLIWIREELQVRTDANSIEADLVNLFDQTTGSGRNVAIVIT